VWLGVVMVFDAGWLVVVMVGVFDADRLMRILDFCVLSILGWSL
jgi:hypothetical protein